MKADKRKGKKFALGGPTSYSGEDDGEGMKMSTPRGQTKSSPSFGEAFKVARKEGLKTFNWQGGTYGTKLKGEDSESKKPPSKASSATFTSTSKAAAPKADAPKADAPKADAPKADAPKADAPKADAPARRGYTRTARSESERTADYAANRRASFAKRVNPFSGLGDLFGMREQERVMRDTGVDRAEARKRLANLEEVEEGSGMRRGGKVKRYASGGSVSSASKRADGIAVKGKTRGKFI